MLSRMHLGSPDGSSGLVQLLNKAWTALEEAELNKRKKELTNDRILLNHNFERALKSS